MSANFCKIKTSLPSIGDEVFLFQVNDEVKKMVLKSYNIYHCLWTDFKDNNFKTSRKTGEELWCYSFEAVKNKNEITKFQNLNVFKNINDKQPELFREVYMTNGELLLRAYLQFQIFNLVWKTELGIYNLADFKFWTYTL